ncbi:MAG TPA: GtrA family protein [Longilinea sp.]|nr:GtrA family protein [Longilinea sp.]
MNTSEKNSGLMMRLPTWIVQAVKFSFVGVLNTAVDWGVYFILTRWVGMTSLPVAAKSISYSAGILNSFFWNRTWTFRSKAQIWTTLAPFVVVNLIGLAINTGVYELCLNILDLHELIALVTATVTTLAWNFILSKFVVFRK